MVIKEMCKSSKLMDVDFVHVSVLPNPHKLSQLVKLTVIYNLALA